MITVNNLKVIGNRICDQFGNPIQLRGISSGDLKETIEVAPFINSQCINWLWDDWKINIFRLAMDTVDGYISNPNAMKALIIKGIDACIAAGIYVIVDWHHDDPNTYREQAKEFFRWLATTYGNYPNIIYEPLAEPKGGINWASIKDYANELIPLIREIDPDSFIIIGTPQWDTDVDVAASDPLPYPNVAYACHIYTGSHGQNFRDKVTACLNKGCPVFVSEWGTTTYTGGGGVFPTESDIWIDFWAANMISWCNWSLWAEDDDNYSGIVVIDASKTGGWLDSDLTTSGRYVRKKLRMEATMVTLEGYILCASEGETHDFGASIVDVAYGANDHFKYLYKVTGKITFSNSTFGDPIVGIKKSGYYKIIGEVPVVPPTEYVVNKGTDGNYAFILNLDSTKFRVEIKKV